MSTDCRFDGPVSQAIDICINYPVYTLCYMTMEGMPTKYRAVWSTKHFTNIFDGPYVCFPLTLQKNCKIMSSSGKMPEAQLSTVESQHLTLQLYN